MSNMLVNLYVFSSRDYVIHNTLRYLNLPTHILGASVSTHILSFVQTNLHLIFCGLIIMKIFNINYDSLRLIDFSCIISLLHIESSFHDLLEEAVNAT